MPISPLPPNSAHPSPPGRRPVTVAPPPSKGILKKSGTGTSEACTEAVQTGRSASGKGVTTMPAGEVHKSIPAACDRKQPSGIKLLSRSIKRQLGPGLLNRLISFFRNRPNAAQRSELWNAFQNLEQSIGKTARQSVASHTRTGENYLAVDKGSNGEKAAALLVDAGLATYSSKPTQGGRIAIEFVRPHNFRQQLRGVETLAHLVPICVNGEGKLDWATMQTKDRHETPLTINNIPVLRGKESIPAGWYTEPEAIQQLEQLQTDRDLLHNLKLVAQGDDQFETARRGIRLLTQVASRAGYSQVEKLFNEKDDTFHYKVIQRVSLLSKGEWQKIIDALENIDPCFAAALQQVKPKVDSARDKEVVDCYQKPKSQEMKALLTKADMPSGLTLVKATDVDDMVERLKEQNSLPAYPLPQVYRQAVKARIDHEIKGCFAAFGLKNRVITRNSLQVALGELRQKRPDYYQRLIDDEQRANLIQEVKELASARDAGTKELKAQARSLNWGDGGNKELTLLFNQSGMLKADENGRFLTKPELFTGEARLLGVAQAYERLARYLPAKGQPMSGKEVADLALKDALEEGIELDAYDWIAAIGKIPVRQDGPAD